MREVILPLVVVALVAMALVARRVLRPPLSTTLFLSAGLSVVAYGALEVVPWVRGVSFFQPIRVQVEPQLSFGAQADGKPTEIAVQVFRGTQLLDEKRIPGLGTAVKPPAGESLRLERLASGTGFRVMAGKTSLGELSSEALAKAGVGSAGVSDEVLPEPLGEPPEAKPEIDVAASDIGEPETQAADSEAAPATAGRAPEQPAPAQVAKARRSIRPVAQNASDRELELRARASQLSREGSNCEGERLLQDGRDERTLALARELKARCRWKGK